MSIYNICVNSWLDPKEPRIVGKLYADDLPEAQMADVKRAISKEMIERGIARVPYTYIRCQKVKSCPHDGDAYWRIK